MCSHDILCNILEDYYLIATSNQPYLMKVQGRKKFTSIVQKIIFCSITGQGLGLTVHAHTGLTIHLSWNSRVRTGSFQNCIARHTIQSAVRYTILNQIRWGSLEGLCKCVFGTITGYDNKNINKVCFHTYLREEMGVKFHCRCRVKLSLEIVENYKRSMFLEDGRMILFEFANSALGEC